MFILISLIALQFKYGISKEYLGSESLVINLEEHLEHSPQKQ